MKKLTMALLAALVVALLFTGVAGAQSLQNGDRGDEVTAIQTRLIELGYLSGKADGIFGKNTENAVLSFQAVNALESTGIADDATQQAILSQDALPKPLTLMPLSDFEKCLSDVNGRLVSYDLSGLTVANGSATLRMSQDVTLICQLVGNDISQIVVTGSQSMKIPCATVLMAADSSISMADSIEVVAQLMQDGQYALQGMTALFETGEDGMQTMRIQAVEAE